MSKTAHSCVSVLAKPSSYKVVGMTASNFSASETIIQSSITLSKISQPIIIESVIN